MNKFQIKGIWTISIIICYSAWFILSMTFNYSNSLYKDPDCLEYDQSKCAMLDNFPSMWYFIHIVILFIIGSIITAIWVNSPPPKNYNRYRRNY